MRKTFFSSIICIMLFSINSYSQNNPRLENTNYAQTKLFDDFNSLNRTTWKVHNGEYFIPPSKRNLLIWLDSIATVNVNQSSGNLALSMLQYPNYRMKNYLQETITANFIAGQLTSTNSYTYGIFECSATFSDQLGAFPAFWTHSDMPCFSSFNNEIDIVEKKIDHINPTLDNHIFYYPSNCNQVWYGYEFNAHDFTWGGAHTFKCIWTPTYIKYFVDNILTKVVQNTGDYRYPTLREHVKLSQQIIEANNNSPYFGVVTPQTSYFHWVRVREFFLAPEITCPSLICTTGTATMDVDPTATNINWTLTPSTLFVTSSGTGTTANIVKSSVTNGLGTITYSFQMPSGETFTASKDIWMGPYSSSNYPITGPSSAPCRQYVYYSIPDLAGVTSINWVWPSSWTYVSGQGTRYLALQTGTTGSGGIVGVQAVNTCGSPASYATMYTAVTGICGYSMFISPNPVSNEATLELTSTEPELQALSIEWELEVFDQFQVQKTKTPKIKEKQYKLNIQDWKDGVYIVRAKIGDEVITEKLVVKH